MTTTAPDTLAFLRETLPGFASLCRLASLPGPLARLLTGRWLRRHARSAPVEPVVRAVRLVTTDDRAFCRRVHLDGWRDVANQERVRFQLLDDGEMLWPVAARALVLFGDLDLTSGPGASRRLVPPSGKGTFAPRAETSAPSDPSRFTVRTHALDDGRFRVVVETQET